NSRRCTRQNSITTKKEITNANTSPRYVRTIVPSGSPAASWAISTSGSASRVSAIATAASVKAINRSRLRLSTPCLTTDGRSAGRFVDPGRRARCRSRSAGQVVDPFLVGRHVVGDRGLVQIQMLQYGVPARTGPRREPHRGDELLVGQSELGRGDG